MKSVLIDTSSGFLSFTAAEDDSLMGTYSVKTGRKMNEVFLSSFDFFLKSIKLKLNEIDNFYTVTGPGSFTGIRIGISTMLGITSGLKKDLRGISSLDAAALCLNTNKLSVACKLRMKEYAVRNYDFENNNFSDYHYLLENDLPNDTFIINGNMSTALTLNLTLAIINKRFGFFLRDYIPFYMQKSEAEIQFDKKSGN